MATAKIAAPPEYITGTLFADGKNHHMARWAGTYDLEKDGIVLHVHVQPRAGRTAVVGRHGDAVKLRVAAPPVDDRANRAVADLLAELFGVKAVDVELTSGATSRVKRFRLKGVDAEEVDTRLDAAVDDAGGPRAARHS